MIDGVLTVDELARRSGVPVRTIRYYQSEGVLPGPQRVGRQARYDQSHVDRLRLIAELQGRGLRLTAIADLLHRTGERHTSLPDWLGLGEALDRPWIDDEPALLSERELLGRLAGRAATVPDLEAVALVERRTDTIPVTYLVPSPALLDLGLDLADAGVDLATSAALRETSRRRLGPLADELVAEITERVSMTRLAEGGPAALSALIEGLRPLALRSVAVVFAHEIERAVRELVEAGVAAELKEGAQ